MSTCRPILFSAPMIRALLDGSKTQTRRIAKVSDWARSVQPKLDGVPRIDVHGTHPTLGGCCKTVWCPYGAVGDLLWVRECAELVSVCGYNVPRASMELKYRADEARVKFDRDAKGSGYDNGGKLFGKAVPSIHMPRWASRLTLRITAVRVERLQAIGHADIAAEGVLEGFDPEFSQTPHNYGRDKAHFAQLWESINGKGSWAASPWVWAITFERVATGPVGGEGEGR